jgi:O-antigen/teichoic acid export membrane protein
MTGVIHGIRWRHRILIGAVDQGVSSAQNFAVFIVVARESTPAQFGAFSVVISVALLSVTFCRAAISEPALLGASDREALRDAHGRAACACGLFVGSALGAGLAVASLGFHGALGPMLLCGGIIVPGLVLQDTCRLIAVMHGRPLLLLSLDLVWIGGWLVVIGLHHTASATANLLVWGISASVAAAIGVLSLGTARINITWSVRYWRLHLARSAGSLVGEWISVSFSAQGATVVVSTFVGLPQAGALRGGQSLFGPLNSFLAAMRVVVTPEVIRLGGSRVRRSRLLLEAMRILMALLTVLICVGLLLLPRGAGTAILGASWPGARALIPAITLGVLLTVAANTALIGLRADGHLRTIARTRPLTSASSVALCLTGALLWGAQGAAWGLASAAGVNLFIFVLAYKRAIARGPEGYAVDAAMPVQPTE